MLWRFFYMCGVCLFVFPLYAKEPSSKVYLNGVPTPVFFNDGDSFRVLSGPLQGSKARLAGFNTLESYGGVHRWGQWHPMELYVLAKKATLNARRGVWHCSSDMSQDTYGRTLWHCPDLARDQISKGLAHAMMPDQRVADASYMQMQQQAMQEKRGIWAHGVPEFILTSLHSANEDPLYGEQYNRLVSTKDGHSEKWTHRETYEECQMVCHASGACMLYVDFKKRYGLSRASCLDHM